MQRSIIFRMPLKLPNNTFGQALSFDDLRLDNTQTGHFMILTGNRFETETGIATITVDAILPNGNVIQNIPFLKKRENIYRFDTVEKDEINIEECPVWREYMITDRMLAKFDTNRIRLNISAVQDSQTPCCVFVEATDFRYTSEMPFHDDHDDDHNNGNGDDGDDSGGDGNGDNPN